MNKKKGVLEVLDEALVKDVKEIGEFLERMDRAFYEQPKKPGRPVLYRDKFHVELRARVKKHRQNHG